MYRMWINWKWPFISPCFPRGNIPTLVTAKVLYFRFKLTKFTKHVVPSYFVYLSHKILCCRLTTQLSQLDMNQKSNNTSEKKSDWDTEDDYVSPFSFLPHALRMPGSYTSRLHLATNHQSALFELKNEEINQITKKSIFFNQRDWRAITPGF